MGSIESASPRRARSSIMSQIKTDIKSAGTPLHAAFYYAVTVVLALAAVVFALASAFLLALASLLLALISLLTTRQLLMKVERSQKQKSLLDAQLIQSQKMSAIGEMSSGIAHEINNPLAIMGQEVEWLRHLLGQLNSKEIDGLAECVDSMNEIARQVERCSEITHRLLSFARKMDPLIQRVDVNKLIEDMTRLVEREAVHKGISIVRNYQADLPQVNADAPLLRQVILNLLNNAVYAIGRDGTITLITRVVGDDALEIAVEDTGGGIPKEHLDKIFDPFFTTKPPGEGTGLGLSLCHTIIERLGGYIAVTSEVKRGTTFTISLPL
jgi:two-component system, NtrC family, sensor kinase